MLKNLILTASPVLNSWKMTADGLWQNIRWQKTFNNVRYALISKENREKGGIVKLLPKSISIYHYLGTW